MKKLKLVLGFVVAINFIVIANQSVFSRELSEVINKTTLNYNVNEEIKEIKQWKNRELALYDQTGNEQNKLQADFLDFFIKRKQFKNPSENEFKSMLTTLFDIQRKSKDKYQALYLVSSFHIAEMCLPYSPKMSHKIFNSLLRNSDSNINNRLNYDINFILGNEAHLDGNFKLALKYYNNCTNNLKPNESYLESKVLITIALCELQLGKIKTAKSHIDLAINLLKEKGDLTLAEESGMKFMESVNSIYLLNTGNLKQAKESLENNYDTHFKTFICVYRYENVASTLLDIYIAEGNKKGYTKIFNDINTIVNSNIETKYKIDLLKIKHDRYEKLGLVDKSKLEFNRLNKIYFEEKKLMTAVTENVIELLMDNQNKTAITYNNEITKKTRYIELSVLSILLVIGFSFTYKKYYSKDIATKKAEIKIKQLHQEKEKNELIQEKLREEVTNLNLVLNMKTDSEKALIDKIKDYKKEKSFNTDQMLMDFQMQLNNLIQIDLKNTNASKNVKGETDVFFEKVKSLHPELNNHELSLCSYIRLKLNSKEISLITGITPGSVRVYKTKLKNKLGLKNEENLNQYLQTI